LVRASKDETLSGVKLRSNNSTFEEEKLDTIKKEKIELVSYLKLLHRTRLCNTRMAYFAE